MVWVPGHLCHSRWPGHKSWQVEVAVFLCANVRSGCEACRHTICPHYTYLTIHCQPVWPSKKSTVYYGEIFGASLCYLPARPHKDQETLKALTEPGHEDFFGGGVVERVRQALSFAGEGCEGSAVSWGSVWRGTFFDPKSQPPWKTEEQNSEQLYHFRCLMFHLCWEGCGLMFGFEIIGLDFASFDSALPDRSVPMTLTSGFVWGDPSLSKMQVGRLRPRTKSAIEIESKTQS